MPTTLVPMSPERRPAWLERSRSEYQAELMSTGVPELSARRLAEDSIAFAFPYGTPTRGHVVFDVATDAGTVVGYLWIGPGTTDDATAWWVWDIGIDAAYRGQGFGRTSMQLGEDYARSQGARTLGLNVFSSNSVARGLYSSLGFETVSERMKKDL